MEILGTNLTFIDLCIFNLEALKDMADNKEQFILHMNKKKEKLEKVKEKINNSYRLSDFDLKIILSSLNQFLYDINKEHECIDDFNLYDY